MKDEILRQEKMLSDIQSQLAKIKTFLIGNIPVEEKITGKEECFLDTIRNNNMAIDEIKGIINSIEEIIMGGNN